MRVVAIVQARLGSTRLPNKVLAPICGKPMIQHVVERAQAIPGIDQVVLAVPADDVQVMFFEQGPLLHALGENPPGKVPIIAGPADDVLARYVLAAKSGRADVIVRVTGDCPLIAPEVCAEVIDFHRTFQSKGDYSYPFASNDTRFSGYPDGLDVEVFSRELLERAHNQVTGPYEREHVTLWMRRQAPFPVLCREADEFSKIKLSVDTQEDLDRVRRIMARIPAGDYYYSWAATKKAIEEEGR